MEHIEPIKPDGWPANDREAELQAIYDAKNAFDHCPNYETKANLISLLNAYDANQASGLGMHRVTKYEVALMNDLFFWGICRLLPSMRCYLYNIIGKTVESQKMTALIYSSMGKEGSIRIPEYEEGLYIQLKIYYCAYQDFIMKNDKSFAEQIIQTIRYEREEIKILMIPESAKIQALFELSKGFTSMLSDISYFHGNKSECIWNFSRDELLMLFGLENELLGETCQNPAQRPLRSVLIGQISNLILKSRHNYNEDYICKYVSEDVASESFTNHEIWMKRIENLNDEKEGQVVKRLFDNREWINVDWVGDLDFSRKRNYYISSFSKSIDDKDMKSRYGPVIFGYKGDKIAELIAPLQKVFYTEKDESTNRPVEKTALRFSLATCFDVLYDEEELKDEFNYLFAVIDIFNMEDKEKNDFLNTIIQYWLFSAKEPKWAPENERRYVLFLYDSYSYQDMVIEDDYLKVKTGLFLYPDFLKGPHKRRDGIEALIDDKRSRLSSKPYIYCHNCFNREYDLVYQVSRCSQCPICKGSDIEMVIPQRTD